MTGLPSAKGGRPLFLETPAQDDLLAIVVAVAQELAVMRERADTVERLLVQKGILGPEDVEDYKPDQSIDLIREQWRQDISEGYSVPSRSELMRRRPVKHANISKRRTPHMSRAPLHLQD